MAALSNGDVKDPEKSASPPAAPVQSGGWGMRPAFDKETAADPNKVNWEGPDDELNPLNWKPAKKWRILAVVSVMTFITPLSSTMFAPGVVQTMPEFNYTNENLATLVVSIYILGFAVGPLLVAPLSEIYGRRPVYIISNALFLIFTIACALSNSLGMLFAFRFLSGCAGSTPVTIGGATIGDMFARDKRGVAMAVWGMGPQLGPVLGPVIGGFLAQAEGWRWTFWLLAIITGMTTILGVVTLRETYPIVILEQKTRRLIRETENKDLKSALYDGTPNSEIFKRAIVRPMKLLLFSPIVFLLSLYLAVLFGYLYLFITTFPIVFAEQYHFNTGVTGLAYLGLGVGSLLGLFIMGKFTDLLYHTQTGRNDGVAKPEFRLLPLMVTCPLIAIAFFWYGWSAEAHTHWIVPIIGTSFFGLAMMPSLLSINMYLIEAYTRYAASAVAATRVFQSIAGTVLPLAGQPMYQRLGLGWGNSILAFIALTFIPVPWLLMKYGEALRTKRPVKL